MHRNGNMRLRPSVNRQNSPILPELAQRPNSLNYRLRHPSFGSSGSLGKLMCE